MSKLNLPILYSQTDSRWANFLLGYNTLSQFNIYNYGCLITDLAVIAQYFGKEINPQGINETLKSVNGFANGGNYIWGSINKIYGDILEKKTDTPGPLTDSQMAEIKTAIDYGYPVMFNIDFNPQTVKLDFHYVVAIGYNPSDENDFLIFDPIGGTLKSLKSYLGWFFPSVRKTVQQYAIYTGPKPKVNEDAILVRIEDNERNIMKASQYDELCTYFKLDTNTMQAKKIIEIIQEMVKQLDNYGKENKQLQQDLYNALQDLKTQGKRIEELELNIEGKVTPLPVDKKPETKPAIAYNDVQNKETFWSKLLSFFITTADEYAKLRNAK